MRWRPPVVHLALLAGCAGAGPTATSAAGLPGSSGTSGSPSAPLPPPPPPASAAAASTAAPATSASVTAAAPSALPSGTCEAGGRAAVGPPSDSEPQASSSFHFTLAIKHGQITDGSFDGKLVEADVTGSLSGGPVALSEGVWAVVRFDVRNGSTERPEGPRQYRVRLIGGKLQVDGFDDADCDFGGTGAAANPAGPAAAPPATALATDAPTLGDAAALSREASEVTTPAAARHWLAALGFSEDELSGLPETRHASGRAETANLDRDAQLESVLIVVASSGEEDGPRSDHAYLVWVDRDGSGARVVERQHIEVQSCIADGDFHVSVEPIHDSALSDVIIDEQQAPTCNGGEIAVEFKRSVYTLERGHVEAIASHEDASVGNRVSGRSEHVATQLVFAGKPPKKAQIRAGKRVKKTLKFDRKKFAYR